MRAVVQRVTKASVVVEGEWISGIEDGLMVLVAVTDEDDQEDVAYLADKIANLRIFSDEEGKMNRSLIDVGGKVLLVSQFTLYGDARKGRRPSFSRSAKGEYANMRFEELATALRDIGLTVQTGVFGAHMEVSLVNDGPVTILLDSDRSL